MFGYIAANKRELKIREYECYRSWYCGLCRTLRTRCGLRGRLSLSYDMTFLAMLLSALYEPKVQHYKCCCPVHPLRRQEGRASVYTEYAADMNLLLTYYKCMDDWNDDRNLPRYLYAKTLEHCLDDIRGRHPRQSDAAARKIAAVTECERRGEKSIDKVSGLFGDVLGNIFMVREDEWKDELYRMGYFLGKYIYLLDAYEDRDIDRKKGNYNVLEKHSSEPGFEDDFRKILTMTMAECAASFERLPVIKDAGILRNILYSGVWGRYSTQECRKEKESGKGTGERDD